MRLLDLFCGAGGAAMGYSRAGFDEIVGVDIKPQPRYPFPFVQGVALEYVFAYGKEFDVIHASPPCQAYSISKNNGCHVGAPMLVAVTRTALENCGRPWVIENVFGAPLRFPVMLCGQSFGLSTGKFDLARHRYFESPIGLMTTPCNHRAGFTIGVYGNGTNAWHRKKFGRCVRQRELCEAMGIDWMTRKELSQAIPPAYTEYLGRQLLAALRA